jgi:hypothetical protein
MRWWISRLLALSVAVAGCAGERHAQQFEWGKQGATTAQRDSDLYECERDTRAGARSFGGGTYGQYQAQNFFMRCMNAKGYALAAAGTFAMPIGDASGGQYKTDDRVMCMFPSVGQPVNLQANACIQGGGTISGPAH